MELKSRCRLCRKCSVLQIEHLLTACLAVLALIGAEAAAPVTASEIRRLDLKQATELSRDIREEFRRTGFNWISPVMFRVRAESMLRGSTRPQESRMGYCGAVKDDSL
jgi:hypothetical protein